MDEDLVIPIAAPARQFLAFSGISHSAHGKRRNSTIRPSFEQKTNQTTNKSKQIQAKQKQRWQHEKQL